MDPATGTTCEAARPAGGRYQAVVSLPDERVVTIGENIRCADEPDFDGSVVEVFQ